MNALKGVPETLYIPLCARMAVSKKFPEYFFDEKALSLQEEIPQSIREKSSEYSLLASAARYHNMDSMVREFIARHPNSNIIFLGAGLETAYFRLHGEQLQGVSFYEIDLPEVMDIRLSVLGECSNETLIGCDMLDMAWTTKIDCSRPTLITAAGVFQYFQESQIISFIQGLQERFKNLEIIFDALDEKGMHYANRYVKKTGNADAPMHFYVADAKAFAQKVGAELLQQRAFFTDARTLLSRKLSLFTRIAMKVVDDKKRLFILHLTFNHRNID